MAFRFIVLAIVPFVFGCQEPSAQSTSQDDAQERQSVEISDLWSRATGVDWPSFLGPTGDSKSTETGLTSPWSESGPPIVWQRKVGVGYGIGSVSQGRYFHFDRQANQARATCLRAETGEVLWTYEYPTAYSDLLGYNNGPRCSPIVDGDRVYLFGAEGMLHCLRVANGELVWAVNTTEQYGVVQNFFGVGSTPVIDGDRLICMVGGSPPGSPALYDSGGQVDGNGTGVVAFNKRTGLASYASPKLATIGDRRWCFILARGGLLGFDPAEGKLDFHYPWRDRKLESVNASTPVVIGDEVFISETYGIGSTLLTVRPGNYDVVWCDPRNRREKSMLAHWNTPIYIDGYLYGCSGRNSPDADLRCIEWKTGKVKWVEQTPRIGRERSSLLYVDGHLVALGEYGSLKLIKVNPEQYELVSQVVLRETTEATDQLRFGARPLLKHPCWAAPVLSHGLLFVRGDDRVVCLDLIPEGA